MRVIDWLLPAFRKKVNEFINQKKEAKNEQDINFNFTLPGCGLLAGILVRAG